MSNAVKLLNYIQVNSGNITFYTELDSGFKKGDRVFISGGGYSNIKYTDKNNSEYNPFHKYASGYLVLEIDDNDSNGILLDIDPYIADVYDNGKEVYVSTTYFISGKFNGGEFGNGIFGTDNTKTVINSKITDNPSKFTNGVMINSEYKYGVSESRYEITKEGYKQKLNEEGGIQSDKGSGFDIEFFNDNNNGLGYTTVIGSKLGRVYNAWHTLTVTEGVLSLDYVPHTLTKFFDLNIELDIKIKDSENTRIYKLKKGLILEPYTFSGSIGRVYDISGDYEIEVYASSLNSFSNANISNTDIFGTDLSNINMGSGNFYWGEMKSGRIGSETSKMIWYDGILSGDNSVIFDAEMKNGYLLGGKWRGAESVGIIKVEKITGGINIFIDPQDIDLFEVNKRTFISYVKSGDDNSFLESFNEKEFNNINLRSFILEDIFYEELYAVLSLTGDIEDISNADFSVAKITQSNIDNVIIDGCEWESGEFYEIPVEVNDIQFINTTSAVIDLNENIAKDNNIILSNITSIYNDKKEIFSDIFYIYHTDASTAFVVFNDADIIGFEKTHSEKSIHAYTKIWKSGIFKSGLWNGGMWIDGTFKSELFFDNDQYNHQSVFGRGYWLNGIISDGLVAGGFFENSVIEGNSVINSGFEGFENNSTVFNSAVVDDVTWKRGELSSGTVNGGTFINGKFTDINFEGGFFTQGLNIYSDEFSGNRSGVMKNDGSYTSLSAPSIVYINSDGTVRLDQPSYFQKGYNILFQDMDSFPNPFNDQMFTVRESSYDGKEVKIDYDASSANPQYLNTDFSEYKSIIIGNTITDIAQMGYDDYWMLDKPLDRIIRVNNGSASVYGDLNDDNIKNITHISGAYTEDNLHGIDNVYIVYGDKVRLLNKFNNTYKDVDINLNSNETILDIQAVSYNSNDINETLFLLTDQRLLYILNIWDEFKELDITGEIITASKKNNSSNISMCVYDSSITYYELIFNINKSIYEIQTEVSVDDISGNITDMAIRDYSESNSVSLWVVKDSYIHLINLNQLNGGVNTEFIINQENTIDISKISISYDGNNLNMIRNKNSRGTVFSSGELSNNIIGFGNLNSEIKLLTSSTKDYKDKYTYWYYDNITSRIIYINENNENLYSDSDIWDVEGYTIHKLIHGEDYSDIMVIAEDDNGYVIIKIVRGSEMTFMRISGSDKIYDLCYSNQKLFILAYDNAYNRYSIVSSAFGDTDISLMQYYNSPSHTPDAFSDIYEYKNASPSFDIIYDNGVYWGNLYNGYGEIYSYVIGVVISGLTKIADINEDVYDLVIVKAGYIKGYMEFYAYISSQTGVYRYYSSGPADITEPTGKKKWSEPLSDNLISSLNMSSISKSSDNTAVYANEGNIIHILSNNYISEEFNLEEIAFGEDNKIYGISRGRIVEVNENAGVNILSGVSPVGVYKQKRNIYTSNFDGDTYDYTLNEPHSLIFAKSFFNGRDALLFIDNTRNGKSVIRYYNLYTNNLETFLTMPYDKLYIDLCYSEQYKRLIAIAEEPTRSELYVITKTKGVYYNNYFNGKYDKIDVIGTKLTLIKDNNVYILNHPPILQTTPIPSSEYELVPQVVYTGNISDNITDVVYNNENNISIKNNGGIEVLTNDGGWSSPIGISDIGDVEHIFNNKYYGSKTGLYDTEGNMKVIDYTYDPSVINNKSEIKSFTFNSSSEGSVVFLYNKGEINTPEYRGVIRKIISSSVVADTQNILNDISEGDFIKMVSIGEIVYCLFKENGINKLYKYDFNFNSVQAIDNPINQYRSNTEKYPSPITYYDQFVEIVDICRYENSIALLYVAGDPQSNVYNIASLGVNNLYNYNDTKISEIYSDSLLGSNIGYDAIDNDGNPEEDRLYDLNGFGGVKYLLKSNSSPLISYNDGKFFFYYGLYANTNNVIMHSPIDEFQVIQNNVYNDIILKVKIKNTNNNGIKGFQPIKAVLRPDIINDVNGEIIGDVSNSSLTIGSEVITLNSDEYFLTFEHTADFNPSVISVSIIGLVNLIGGITDGTEADNINILSKSDGTLQVYITDDQTCSVYAGQPGEGKLFELDKIDNSQWKVIQYEDKNLSSPSDLFYIESSIIPTVVTEKALYTGNEDILNIKTKQVKLKEFESVYDFIDKIKLYTLNKTDVNNLCPYLTSRIIENSLMSNKFRFNTPNGTSRTAYIVSSTWDADSEFVGSWDMPDYKDNEIISEYSIFSNGLFSGIFYDGFFTGGSLGSGSEIKSGHLLSSFNSISSNNIQMKGRSRYDIIDCSKENISGTDFINITVEAMSYEDEKYFSVPAYSMNKGEVIRIPSLFIENKIEIQNIQKISDKVCCINADVTDVELSDNQILSVLGNEIFITTNQTYRQFFGFNEIDSSEIVTTGNNRELHIFINKSINENIFPIGPMYISIGKYFKVSETQSYILSDHFYTDIKIPVAYEIIPEYHFKKNVDYISSGEFMNKIIIGSHSQIFDTSFEKERFNVSISSNNSINDVYINNIKNGSSIIVNNSELRDITINNSVFENNNSFNNCVVMSGDLKGTWNNGAWLNEDEYGLSNGLSSFEGVFKSDIKNITGYYFESGEYMWIEFNSSMEGIKKYGLISLRGFTGSKSNIIGSNISKYFRIEDIKSNKIKIRNPFRYYTENIEGTFIKPFETDRLFPMTKSIRLKDNNSDDIKVGGYRLFNFNNYDFTDGISNTELSDNWYNSPSDIGKAWSINNERATVLTGTTDSSDVTFKPLRQKYDFKKGVEYTITISFYVIKSFANPHDFYVYVDYGTENEKIIYYDDIYASYSTTDVTFTFTPEKDYSEFSFKPVDKQFVIIEIDKIDVEAYVDSFERDINLAYVSPSAWNGGKFTGDFDGIWNKGEYNGGIFEGKWFGLPDSYFYSGDTSVKVTQFNDKYLVSLELEDDFFEIDDFIYLKYLPQFNGSENFEISAPVYSYVESIEFGAGFSKGIKYFTETPISEGDYKIQVIKYQSNKRFISDFNAEIAGNVTTSDQKSIYEYKVDSDTVNTSILFNETAPNYILIDDLINRSISDNQTDEFTFDLWVKPYSENLTPILSFHNSEDNMKGVKIFTSNEKVYITFVNELNEEENVELDNINLNQWNHLSMFYNSGVFYYSINKSSISTIQSNAVFSKYDICYIAKLITGSTSESWLAEKLSIDELRFWNKDMRDSFPLFADYKFQNTYLREITSYFNFDSLSYDTKLYFPEQEQYFELNENKVYLLKDKNNNDFKFEGIDTFVEFDINIDSNNTENKIITFEQYRETSVSQSKNNYSYKKYYLEIFAVESPYYNEKYNIGIRERITTGDKDSIDSVLYDSLISNTINEYKNLSHNPEAYTAENIKYNSGIQIIESDIDYSVWNSIIMDGNKLFLNGKYIGEYNTAGKYFSNSPDTRIRLGNYALESNEASAVGFVRNLNLWKDDSMENTYSILRIKSDENTEIFNESSEYLRDKNDEIRIPIIEDNKIKGDSSIYVPSDNYMEKFTGSDSYFDNTQWIKNSNILNNSLPDSQWLSGSDFISVNTDNLNLQGGSSFQNNMHFLTYQGGSFNSIKISGMENFKFFGKDLADDNGDVHIHITDSGYIIFDKIIELESDNNSFEPYPIVKWLDKENDWVRKQTTSTDSIFINTILDVRSDNGGEVKYADRDDEFIISYFGKETDIISPDDSSGDDFRDYKYILENNLDSTQTLFSYFVMRIDKKTSAITFYIRRLGESTSQKYIGVRRNDGFLCTVNGEESLYKIPQSDYPSESGVVRSEYAGDTDFVIGTGSTDENITVNPKSEYIVFLPRFENNEDYSWVSDVYNGNIENSDISGREILYRFENNINKYELDPNRYSSTDVPSLNLKYYSYILDSIIDFDLNDFIIPEYNKNSEFIKNMNESSVPYLSVFNNGYFKSDIWHNGIFKGGEIIKENFVWLFGNKIGGELKGGDKINEYAYWVGGFHNGNESDISNVIWHRGVFNGGNWNSGHWMSLNSDMGYDKEYSLFNKGVWYSIPDYTENTELNNLITFANNGDFENGTVDQILTTEWGFTSLNVCDLVKSDLYSYKGNYSAGISYDSTNTKSFADAVPSFKSVNMKVNKNTKYTIRVKVYLIRKSLYINTYADPGILIKAHGAEDDIESIGLVSRYYDKTHIINGDEYYFIDEDNNEKWTEISHTFNSGNNDNIYFTFDYYGKYYPESLSSPEKSVYLDNIEMLGTQVNTEVFDQFSNSSHKSIWHGGVWNSAPMLKSDNTYFNYSYESENSIQYTLGKNKIQLSKVNSTWLGGLWLRGDFNGGIFANGFWNSITDNNTFIPNTEYEISAGGEYDSNASVFRGGKMMNSIWHGGIIEDNDDMLNIVFGDLISNYSNFRNKSNQKDFTWNNNFIFKRSSLIDKFSIVNGINTFSGVEEDEEKQIDRVKSQYNDDGIMSVYFKRGYFNNGVFQFSEFNSLTLNNDKQVINSAEEIENNSIFKGLFYNSYFNGGLFKAEASSDVPPFGVDTPKSIFYYSKWDTGYWKAIGIDNASGYLDTQNTTEITNAIFSRSIWNSGVFEGGVFDLSIWKSGTELPGLNNKINGLTVPITRSLDNVSFNVDYNFNKDNFVYGIGDQRDINNVTYNNFYNVLKDKNHRFAGSVDNMASVWMNGHMRGSVWLGGTWLRGMFSHKDIKSGDLDIFTNNILTDSTQLGIWVRGLWLSGYFSYFNDKNIKINNIDIFSNAHLYDNPFKTDITLNNTGKRCLFMSIDSTIAKNNNSIIGMSDVDFGEYVSNVSNDFENKHNFASFYCRRNVKNSYTTSTDKKYFNIFNGSFINGVYYTRKNNDESGNNSIISLFATMSDKFLDTSDIGSNPKINTIDNSSIFNSNIKLSSDISVDIPYGIPFVTWDNMWSETGISDTDDFFDRYNNGFISNNSELITNSIHRHNAEEAGVTGEYGDNTLVDSLSSFIDFDGTQKSSFAQGGGIKWHKDEPDGEPRFTDDIL